MRLRKDTTIFSEIISHLQIKYIKLRKQLLAYTLFYI